MGFSSLRIHNEIASGQERLILLQSKAQGFWSAPELKTVSQRPSWCQMKLVVTLYDLVKKKTLIPLE